MLVLSFAAPTPPLSANQATRMHWAARRKRLDPWRDAGMVVMRARLREGDLAARPPYLITVFLPVATSGRADPHNYTSFTVKALIDGLVRGGLAPDDTTEWVSVADPVLDVQHRSKRLPGAPHGTVRVEIDSRPERV